jgi:hypothetical protein
MSAFVIIVVGLMGMMFLAMSLIGLKHGNDRF